MIQSSYELQYKHDNKRFKLNIELGKTGNISDVRLDGIPSDYRTPFLLQKVYGWLNSNVALPRVRLMLQRETLFPYTEVEFLMRLATDLERLRSAAVATARGD
jgi:hypothetical protein